MPNRDGYFGLDVDPREVPAYGVSEAAGYLQIPVATLTSWVAGRPYETQAGRRQWSPVIVLPDSKQRALSFTNLVEAHVLSSVRRTHRLSFDAIRAALKFVEQRLQVGHPLANQDFETDGKDLFIRELGKIVNASRSEQPTLSEIMGFYLKRIERDRHGLALRLYPYTRSHPAFDSAEKLIVFDPSIQFGRPVLAGTGIKTSVILERFIAGESAEELAQDYDRPRAQIDEAIRWEKYRVAA